jgi:hypothetical protein
VRHPELILDARSGPADWLSLRGWRRLFLTSLIVCLPVPMLAASGLAVPLPTIVYRVAVGVAERTQEVAVGVPGFDAVVAEATESLAGVRSSSLPRSWQLPGRRAAARVPMTPEATTSSPINRGDLPRPR